MGPKKVARGAGTGASVPVEECQICGHAPLDRVLSLGYMPPVNQMVAIGAMILTPLAHKFAPGITASSYEVIAYALLWIAAALTVYTGVVYFRNGMAHISTEPSPR